MKNYILNYSVEQHGPSAAKHEKKEEDVFEDCNDHNYYKTTPRMVSVEVKKS